MISNNIYFENLRIMHDLFVKTLKNCYLKKLSNNIFYNLKRVNNLIIFCFS